MNDSAGLEQERLDSQRRLVRRARAQGRRWYLRGVLMLLVAAWSFWRGGSLYVTVGVVMVALSAMSFHLGRNLRASAAEAERKIALMRGER